MSSGKRINALQPHEKHSLHVWGEKNRERLKQKELTEEDFAKEAEATLGFRVTTGNITGLRESMGVRGQHGGYRVHGEPTAILARRVASLYEDLYGSAPEDLLAISKRKH